MRQSGVNDGYCRVASLIHLEAPWLAGAGRDGNFRCMACVLIEPLVCVCVLLSAGVDQHIIFGGN